MKKNDPLLAVDPTSQSVSSVPRKMLPSTEGERNRVSEGVRKDEEKRRERKEREERERKGVECEREPLSGPRLKMY